MGNMLQTQDREGKFTYIENQKIVIRTFSTPFLFPSIEPGVLIELPFQNWRINDLGAVGTPQAQLMNSLQAAWESERQFGDQWMGCCDQICMAVALDENCCLQSTKHKVIVFI